MISDRKFFLKAVVIGDGGVGKTSLIVRHVDKKFDEEYKPTLGFDISLKTIPVEDAKAELLLWDIGGQAIFKEIRESYLEGSHCCFIVFDLTNKESFEHLKDWLTELKRFAGEIPFMIIGNKNDLKDKRKISKEEMEKKAKEIGAVYCFETSAKTGDGVDDAFKELTNASVEYFKNLKK
ncbi:MAG: GTP-binding protein [Candidatus Helarchaeota archaeon]|nr:GTP-binding protein [Candidatus Helarchaeota archaeon]